MLSDLVALLWAPLLMCLVLTGIHAYLGIHVIAREVIFVDIAMAQIAAMGATAAFLAGFDLDSRTSWAAALGCTLIGAVVLTFTRTRERHVSQEAVIGVIYAVSAAAAVLLADRAPHGAEHVRTMLVGNILTATPDEVARVAVLYASIGLVHWLARKPLLLISTDPATAFAQGWRDLLFYSTFGLVVASSVRIGGVLLVFSYLIVPSLAAIALGGSIGSRLVIGWVFGGAVSVLGITASAAFDLPTGATVVCAFGAALALLWGLAPRARYRAAAAAARGAAIPQTQASAAGDTPPRP
jgi:zinc/manganese transport system permease protein